MSAANEKTIRWHELTPDLRDEVIHEKVMGLSIEAGECEHRLGTFHIACPICKAHWEEYELLRSHRHAKSIPGYTQSLDAAWLVLLKMVGNYSRWDDDTYTGTFGVFADALLRYGDTYGGAEIYPAVAIFAIVKTWTSERICVAALRACGYEVQ